MRNDYRNTIYCPELKGIKERKKAVEDMIKTDHSRARDMHNYLSPNDGKYKGEFIRAYNGKCSYCGVSNDIVSKSFFEIDHFFYKESFSSKAEAGEMDNLVLACHTCNHRKGAFEIPKEDADKLHPDGDGILGCFERDEKYYIHISDRNEDEVVKLFYEKLGLGDELRRLDYLLMSIYGLQNQLHSIEGMSEAYEKVGQMAGLLRKKRNMV